MQHRHMTFPQRKITKSYRTCKAISTGTSNFGSNRISNLSPTVNPATAGRLLNLSLSQKKYLHMFLLNY